MFLLSFFLNILILLQNLQNLMTDNSISPIYYSSLFFTFKSFSFNGYLAFDLNIKSTNP